MSEKKEQPESKIIKASSKAGKTGGYGFSYASLSDIVKAGMELPKMRLTVMADGRQFIEYESNGEWLLGAEVITDFKSPGMNACQAYGSALTYARRYTAQLALGLAVDDDKNVETAGAIQREKAPAKDYTDRPATDKQIATIRQMLGSGADAVLKHNAPLTIGKASKLIAAISEKLATQRKQEAEAPAEPTTEPADDPTAPISLDDIPF